MNDGSFMAQFQAQNSQQSVAREQALRQRKAAVEAEKKVADERDTEAAKRRSDLLKSMMPKPRRRQGKKSSKSGKARGPALSAVFGDQGGTASAAVGGSGGAGSSAGGEELSPASVLASIDKLVVMSQQMGERSAIIVAKKEYEQGVREYVVL